jgi:hypothetical protein
MFERSDNRFLAEIRSRLYVSVVSDVLDALGHTEQAMAARIRPLDDSLVLVGYARTGVYNDVYHVAKGENPRAIEQQVLAGAFDKAFGEDHTRRDLAAGMKLKDVFDRYGVL